MHGLKLMICIAYDYCCLDCIYPIELHVYKIIDFRPLRHYKNTYYNYKEIILNALETRYCFRSFRIIIMTAVFVFVV